jgi:hypothetical protein
MAMCTYTHPCLACPYDCLARYAHTLDANLRVEGGVIRTPPTWAFAYIPTSGLRYAALRGIHLSFSDFATPTIQRSLRNIIISSIHHPANMRGLGLQPPESYSHLQAEHGRTVTACRSPVHWLSA